MISIARNFRSAAIVAIAVAALAGTGALAETLSSQGATHSTHAKSSSAPRATPSPESSESPDVNRPDSDEQSEKTDVDTPDTDKADADKHGDCVSAAARNHSLLADNHHGGKNHGAAVSDAAHSCPK